MYLVSGLGGAELNPMAASIRPVLVLLATLPLGIAQTLMYSSILVLFVNSLLRAAVLHFGFVFCGVL